MLKKVIFIILSLCSEFIYCQTNCTFEDIFPIKLGVTKFQATTSIANSNNLKEIKEEESFLRNSNRWEKPFYLKGDSVYRSKIAVTFIGNSCFNAKENKMDLKFVDDKLYTITLTLTFEKNDFKQSLENYKNLIPILKKNFVDWEEFVNNSTLNDVKEQTGEGFTFYPTKKIKRNKIKIEDLTLTFFVDYEVKKSKDTNEFYRTTNVKNYIIEIEYVNLKGTKLTNEQY